MASLLAAEPYKRGTLMAPIGPNSTALYSNGIMAVKVMKNRLKRPSDYLSVNEIRFILTVPSHPNLLQIFNLFIDTFSGKLHIAMEAMNHNLFQFLEKNHSRPLADGVVKSLLAQLLNAIRHIHSYGYFHRDVKPENILVSNFQAYYGKSSPPEGLKKEPFVLKLCDYGLARHLENTKALTQYVSTRWYRAPEILLRLKKYSFPIDIWAFACVAVEVTTFQPLFAGLNETDQLWQILKELGNPSLNNRSDEDLGGEWPEGVDLAEKMGFLLPFVQPNSIHNIVDSRWKELASAVQLCLMWDPSKRPTANQLARMLYFNDTTVQDEANSKQLGSLSLHDTDVVVDDVFNTPLSVSVESTAEMSPIETSNMAAPNEDTPKMDLYSDPAYFYTSWSRSSSDADISCQEPFNMESATINGTMTGTFSTHETEELVPKAAVDSHKGLALEHFHLPADTSMGSNGILC